MFGSVFGASWNRNDNGILNLSGLASYLVLILSKIPGTNFFPALYGDAIFVALFILFNLSLPSQDYFNWYNG
jgi:hypothetical protein